MVVKLKVARRCRDMVAKDDKDEQIALLRDALKNIRAEVKYLDDNIWLDDDSRQQIYDKVVQLIETTLLDTTF